MTLEGDLGCCGVDPGLTRGVTGRFRVVSFC